MVTFNNALRPHQTQTPTPNSSSNSAKSRTEFTNDLSEDLKKSLVQRASETFTALLSGDTITANTIARLLNRQHKNVTAVLARTTSATEAVKELTNSKMATARRVLAGMTDAEIQSLLGSVKG